MSEKIDAVKGFLSKNKRSMIILSALLVVAGVAVVYNESHSPVPPSSANISAHGNAVVGNSTAQYRRQLQTYSNAKASSALNSNSSYIAPIIPQTSKSSLLSSLPSIKVKKHKAPDAMSYTAKTSSAPENNNVQNPQYVDYSKDPMYKSYVSEMEKVNKMYLKVQVPPSTGTVVLYTPKEVKTPVSAPSASAAKHKVKSPSESSLIPGTVLYSTTMTELDSSIPSVCMAEVDVGRYRGAKLFGQFQRHKGYLVLQFKSMVWRRAQFRINGVAINPNTSMEAVRTSVNYHTLSRFGDLVGGSFLAGMAQLGQAVQQQGQRIISTPVSTSIAYPPLNPTEEGIIALGGAGSTLSQTLGQELIQGFNRKPTVKLAAGSNIAVLIVKGSATPVGKTQGQLDRAALAKQSPQSVNPMQQPQSGYASPYGGYAPSQYNGTTIYR